MAGGLVGTTQTKGTENAKELRARAVPLQTGAVSQPVGI